MSTQTLSTQHSGLYSSSRQTFTGKALRVLVAFLRRMFVRVMIYQAARRTYMELAQLDERTLRDIGLTHSSLQHISHAKASEIWGANHPFR